MPYEVRTLCTCSLTYLHTTILTSRIMKVTVIYDFKSAKSIEDCSADKAVIKMSYKEYYELTETLFNCALELIGKEESLKAMEVYKKLRKFDTKSII